MRRVVMVVIAAGLLAACGLEDRSGGDSHLPTAGLGPFAKPEVSATTPAEEPFVLSQNGVAYGDPAALSEGSGFRLWFSRHPVAGGALEIWTVRLPGITALPEGEPVLALAASEPWEGGNVWAPSVIRGADGGLLLYYTAGDPAAPLIARAHSSDGQSWIKDGMVMAGASDPAALRVGERIYLYTARPDQGAIDLAIADDGMTFTPMGAVLRPRPELPAAFDREGVRSPAVSGGLTPAGDLAIDLYWTGRGPQDASAIGAAGSRDGLTFSRFTVLGPAEGVLEPGMTDEQAPSVVRFADHAVMFFGQARVITPSIAVATCP
jgi:hypothetical protein